MGNSIYSKKYNVPEGIHETNLEPVKYHKEIQTHSDIEVVKRLENIKIYIVLSNYTYTYDGNLENAPHTIYKMSELDWAKHMENILITQRKSCPWVIEHDRIRQSHIQIYKNNRSGLIDPRQLMEYKWDLEPVMPPCNFGKMGNQPIIRCPGNDTQFQLLINKQKLKTNPSFNGFVLNTQGCRGFCYYKYIVEIESHTVSCKMCSEPQVLPV